METQTVQSYVRNKHSKVEAPIEENSNIIVYLVLAIIVQVLLVAAPIIMLTIVFTGATGYAYHIVKDNMPTTVAETPPAPLDKPKRHYEHRLTVNDYSTGKSIKV